MGNLATHRGTPVFAAGKFGNAMSGVMAAASGTAWNSTVGTLEFWAKTAGATGVRVMVGNNGTADNGIWVGHKPSGNASFATGSDTAIMESSKAVLDGLWHHYALTINGSKETLWVDGVLAVERAIASTFTFGGGVSAVGGFGNTATFDFGGQVDEVRISSTVRYTATFTPPTAAFTSDANTTALYHLDTDGTDSVTGGGGGGSTGLAPNSTAILYSPYTWDVTATRAKTITPGAYLRFGITGSTATLNFDTTALTAPYPQIKYRVDGAGWVTATVAATVALTIPSDNAWGTHVIEVVVKSTSEFVTRWTPQNAHVSLTGITAASLVAVESANLRILVLGDSITEGYKSLANGTTPTESDATVGWAFQLARLVGAEVGVVGYGGISWLAAGQGGVPALPSSYDLLWGGGPTRSLTTSAPDAIVINMGENDTGDVTSAATSFLNALLTATPSSTRILLMRPFSGKHAAELTAAVTAVASSRVAYVDTTGWFSSADSSDTQHPYGYTSVATLGPRTAAAVRTALGKGATWINVGGVAKPASIIRR